MSQDNGELLMDACDHILGDPALAPEFDKAGKLTKTHCNAAALFVAQALGCGEFDSPGGRPLLADEMIAVMVANASGKWKVVTGSEATIHALSGGLAYAAKTSGELGAAHGHIAVIYPVGMQRSGSWKADVPILANVGKTNGQVKTSEAFPVLRGQPSYFTWTENA